MEMLKSWAKVFVAYLLGCLLASGADVFAVSWTDLRTWLAGAVAAVLPLVITWLDPTDGRWGR
jgi:hypothetical protein